VAALEIRGVSVANSQKTIIHVLYVNVNDKRKYEEEEIFGNDLKK
jgi:hypothetical protein